MELKETTIRTKEDTLIIDNSDYFKFIFKKTEKISCAVFYVVRSSQHIRQEDIVVTDLESATRRLLDVSLESLTYTAHDVFMKATQIKQALVVCETKLRVMHAARLLSQDLLEVFVHEIDSVQRSLRKYTESALVNPLDTEESFSTHITQRRQPRLKLGESTGIPKKTGESQTVDRRERVLTVIKDKREATIKDITELISDCSEKTIQRELTNLIKDNIIVREGERRWSKYKLI